MELIAQAREGDSSAITRLVDCYRDYLLLVANQELDSELNAKLGASDVVQQSMVDLHQNLDQFRGQSRQEFLAWLRQILRNNMRKSQRHFATRKRSSRREVNIQEQSAVARGLVDDQLTPSSEAIRRERLQAAGHALGTLPADYQTVIELRNFQQLDFETIGQRMQRPSDAARKLWSRAIEALQRAMDQRASDPPTCRTAENHHEQRRSND